MKKSFLYLMSVMMVVMLSFGVTSCSSNDDDDDGVSTAPITIDAGEKTVIQGAKTISSLDEFVAYVDKDLSVEAFHVGETTLTVNSKKNIKITVTPKYDLYDGPILKWGCDQSYIKSNQKQGTLSSKSTSEGLFYTNVGKADAILMYQFDSGKLKNVGAVLSTSYATAYANFLMERYLMLPYEKDNDTYFIGIDALEVEKAKSYVVLQVYDYATLIAVYMNPANVNKTRSEFELMNYAKTIKDEFVKQFNK